MVTVWQAAATVMLADRSPAWTMDRFLYFLGYTLLFVGAILAGALVIVWLDRWRKRQSTQGMTTGDQLTHFRELYERGELSPEEFARVRDLLGTRLRQEMQVPAPPAQPAPMAPDSPAAAEQEADIVVDPEVPPNGPTASGSPAG
jgi:hypothetical protein